ncbi:MAG: ATPase, T2SS/T4P/T4SS family [Amaricoccus sp.]|uniref:ATPase, T2SS/T4P/T4SS family n=1 Tax=Amaricoccus sp. TaxID=1872485 RepID=UPI003315A58B
MNAVSPREESAARTLARLSHHLGAEIIALLAQPGLSELSANPDGSVFVDRVGQDGMQRVGSIEPQRVELFVTAVGASLGLCIDRGSSPALSAELPPGDPWRGARLEALLPPAARAPCFSLRMHASAVFPLAEYEARGIMSADQRRAIESAVQARHNILVVGETLSGKSTLLNAIIAHVAAVTPAARFVILEDTTELQCAAANVVQLHTSGSLDMAALLRSAMRLRPDVIAIGEVRGKEALSFVDALGTGHTGYCTTHAGSALGGLRRLETLIRQASVDPQREQIAAALDLIVVIRRDPKSPASRRVSEVLALDSELSADGAYVLSPSKEPPR